MDGNDGMTTRLMDDRARKDLSPLGYWDRYARQVDDTGTDAHTDGGPGRMFTVKEVSVACGLPQPVIAQKVSRSLTAAGWMYSAEQVQEAVELAASLRSAAAILPGG
jgi:hypothetical protein